MAIYAGWHSLQCAQRKTVILKTAGNAPFSKRSALTFNKI